MLLYHGTSERVARLALTQGLWPRQDTESKGNWDHTVPSRSDLVYITRAYAPYFAGHTAKTDERWGIVEIDSDELYPFIDDGFNGILPDEDFLEQASRGMSPDDFKGVLSADAIDELAACKTMEERTIWFRDSMEMFAGLWEKSIEKLGNAAYLGTIPTNAITRVALFEPSSNPFVVMAAADPMISLLNYMICGQKYRALTDWFFRFDEQIARDVLNDFGIPLTGVFKQRHEYAMKELAKRDGLEVIQNESNSSHKEPSSDLCESS